MKANQYLLCIAFMTNVSVGFSQNPDKIDLESRKVLILNESINTEHFDGFSRE